MLFFLKNIPLHRVHARNPNTLVFHKLFILIFLSLWTSVSGQEFKKVSCKASDILEARANLPKRYIIYQISYPRLDTLLGMHLPVSNEPLEINLPLGFNAFEIFVCQPSAVMSPALQKKYPGIRSWAGKGKTKKTADARIDRNEKGFAAMISHAGTTWMMKPVKLKRKGSFVLLYAKHDAPRKKGSPYSKDEVVR
ncbi:MAG: hypothetical protein ACK5JC_09055 [Bacteroidota bacterium]